MSLLSGLNGFFGLDIGTTAVRLVELNSTEKEKRLSKYAYVPIDQQLSVSDSKADQQKLGQIIAQLVGQARVSTKNVAVGLPSNRVFTTVADIDRVAPNELAQAIKYQADSLIPTPLNESKIDWSLIGDSPSDKTKIEVLLSSVTNGYVEERLNMLESVGLNVISFEPDNLALARSLVATDATMPQLIIDVGAISTDIVVIMGGFPRLTRSIPTGTSSLVRAAAQNLNIEEPQAEQFIFKFGLIRDKLEGQVYQSIIGIVDTLMTEVDKSIKFFQTRYPQVALENLIVTGGASALPEFPLYIANRFGMKVEIGNAWKNVVFAADRRDELQSLSNQFSVAVGLAERKE